MPADPSYRPPPNAIQNEYGFWIDPNTGDLTPGQTTPGMTGSGGGVQTEAGTGKHFMMVNGQKKYISPVAFDPNTPTEAPSFFHHGSTFNTETGEMENPFDWGSIATIGVGSLLGVGALAAGGAFGGAAASAGGATGGVTGGAAGGAAGGATGGAVGGAAALPVIPTTTLGTVTPLAGATMPSAAGIAGTAGAGAALPTIPTTTLGTQTPLAGATMPAGTGAGVLPATKIGEGMAGTPSSAATRIGDVAKGGGSGIGKYLLDHSEGLARLGLGTVGTILGNRAVDNATQAQTDAINKAIAAAQGLYDRQAAMEKPYQDIGTQALGKLSSHQEFKPFVPGQPLSSYNMNGNGFMATPGSLSDFVNDPSRTILGSKGFTPEEIERYRQARNFGGMMTGGVNGLPPGLPPNQDPNMARLPDDAILASGGGIGAGVPGSDAARALAAARARQGGYQLPPGLGAAIGAGALGAGEAMGGNFKPPNMPKTGGIGGLPPGMGMPPGGPGPGGQGPMIPGQGGMPPYGGPMPMMGSLANGGVPDPNGMRLMGQMPGSNAGQGGNPQFSGRMVLLRGPNGNTQSVPEEAAPMLIQMGAQRVG